MSSATVTSAPAGSAPRRVSPPPSPIGLLVAPFRVLLAHRRTIEAFVRRDIRSRYVTSVMGVSWAIIQPLALLSLYTFIFAHVLKVRLGGSGSTASFALYLFCGMLPWLAFAESISRATSVILDHAHLIKKVVFPAEILPVYVVVSALVSEFVGLAIFLAAIGLFYQGLGWPVLGLPVVVGLQLLFTLGLAWLLAALNVFLRDVGQVLGLAMTLWLFLTPIFYPPELIPAGLRWLLALNPMHYVVEAYRALLLEQRLPAPAHVGALAAMALGAFVTGHWFFLRSKDAFVDVL